MKKVAKKNNSVDKLTESEPFRMKTEDELTGWVKELAISTKAVPDFDHKAEYHKHLEEKYFKDNK